MATEVGLWRNDRHQYFANYADTGPLGPLPGVTATIGVMDKPAIAIWRGNTVAGIIADRLPLFTEMLSTGGREAAVKWASSLPDYQRDTAANLGSRVHILAEQVGRGASPDLTPEEKPYLDAYLAATKDWDVVSLEKMVCNLTDLWGGTFDTIARIDGELWMVDTKTWRKRPEAGRDMYAETAMQLAAYARAEFIGLPNDPQRHRMPQIERCGVLHLRPDLYESGYRLIPFDVTDADYSGFLGLLAAYRWKQTRAKVVIQDRIEAIA